MAHDQIVHSNVCNNHGHRITNFTLEAVEKGSPVRFSSEFFCAACGMTLDEMRTPPVPPKVKRTRKPKVEAAVEIQQ
jgi:hypothetical protein